ncbi:hypothetical protein BSKO_11816 [Bryopsis sp. KO-2023]|nr:hypothetical protein BSKO_11816 [Bryopsis sp. KO-2023]
MAYLPRCDLLESCDMHLVVEEENFPVHSQIMLVHSNVLGNMIQDLKGGELGGINPTPFTVTLPDKRTDIDLMLQYFYRKRQVVKEFQDAATLIKLSDKYDIPFLVELCEDMLCNLVPNMHLLGYRYGDNVEEESIPIGDPDRQLWDLAKWLSFAERLNMKKLLPKCQHALMEWFEDFECNSFGSREEDMAVPTEKDVLYELVDKNRVSAKTLGAILLACYRRQSVDRLHILMSLGSSD